MHDIRRVARWLDVDHGRRSTRCRCVSPPAHYMENDGAFSYIPVRKWFVLPTVIKLTGSES
ncbi:hypothetical protein EMIT0158MI4_20002 [Burkholderia ambifaria]